MTDAIRKGPSDAELSRRCRRGDAQAWREVVCRQSPRVYRLAVGMLRSGPDAEDACQEVFLRMFRSLDSYDPARPMGPWVSRIAYHVCLRRLAGPAQRIAAASDPIEVQPVANARASSPEAQAAGREEARALESALADLPAQDRALLNLRYREGMSDAEVATAAAMAVGTVKTRIFRARQRLRQVLSKVMARGEP